MFECFSFFPTIPHNPPTISDAEVKILNWLLDEYQTDLLEEFEAIYKTNSYNENNIDYYKNEYGKLIDSLPNFKVIDRYVNKLTDFANGLPNEKLIIIQNYLENLQLNVLENITTLLEECHHLVENARCDYHDRTQLTMLLDKLMFIPLYIPIANDYALLDGNAIFKFQKNHIKLKQFQLRIDGIAYAIELFQSYLAEKNMNTRTFYTHT